jgi:hypothetical protein
MGALPTEPLLPVEHVWELRLEEFEEGHVVRQFDCLDCGAVRFE